MIQSLPLILSGTQHLTWMIFYKTISFCLIFKIFNFFFSLFVTTYLLSPLASFFFSIILEVMLHSWPLPLRASMGPRQNRKSIKTSHRNRSGSKFPQLLFWFRKMEPVLSSLALGSWMKAELRIGNENRRIVVTCFELFFLCVHFL